LAQATLCYMRSQLPLPKGGVTPPIFGPCLRWPNGICIRIQLGTEVGLSLGDIVLDGDPAPPPLKAHSPQILANVRCSQTDGLTKMPLSMEVGLGPGDCVRWGPSSSPEKAQFWPMSIMANGWMNQDATWYGGKPPRRRCVKWGRSSPCKWGTALQFSMSIVAKRLDG